MRSHCISEQDLLDLLSALFYVFPAVLSVYFPDAPYPSHAWGTIGSVNFRWDLEPSQISLNMIATSKENQERRVVDAWKSIAGMAHSRRLIAALNYFHSGCRLLEAGANRFEFAAEALLNFAKSLQSLFGESREDVRRGLRDVCGYNKQEIEGKFIPIMILRNEFDIGHISLASLEKNELRIVHSCIDMSESAMRELLKSILQKVETQEYDPRDGRHFKLPPEKKRILRSIEENISKVVRK